MYLLQTFRKCYCHAIKSSFPAFISFLLSPLGILSSQFLTLYSLHVFKLHYQTSLSPLREMLLHEILMNTESSSGTISISASESRHWHRYHYATIWCAIRAAMSGEYPPFTKKYGRVLDAYGRLIKMWRPFVSTSLELCGFISFFKIFLSARHYNNVSSIARFFLVSWWRTVWRKKKGSIHIFGPLLQRVLLIWLYPLFQLFGWARARARAQMWRVRWGRLGRVQCASMEVYGFL